MTEKEIISGCVKGEQKAQEALFKKYYGRMYAVSLRYEKDEFRAKELVQDGFIKIFDKIKTFKGSGSFEGWMKKIFVNIFLDRKRYNNTKKSGTDYLPNNFSLEGGISFNQYGDNYDGSSGEDFIFNKSLGETHTDPEDFEVGELEMASKEDIFEAVQRLSPAYRTIFCMYVLDEYTHQEIVDELGISLGTSKSNLYKARRILKERLKDKLHLEISYE
jgi:RNA polymerase sigma-70 factor (ECF subfamily)